MAASKARIEKSASAFRSIGEAASEVGLEPHVLRYWETRFPRQLNPVKRPDGRRLYRPQDIDALRAIRLLVHTHGMTLKGAKSILAAQGVGAVLSGSAILSTAHAARPAGSPARALQAQLAQALEDRPLAGEDGAPVRRERLAGTLNELHDLKTRLDALRQRPVA